MCPFTELWSFGGWEPQSLCPIVLKGHHAPFPRLPCSSCQDQGLRKSNLPPS
ncbi:hypothetical protein BJV74DRAFT_858555 [Russula compacta]|nr:hypothetical protein BJV74DRAFT_858555 [Russula compacta]